MKLKSFSQYILEKSMVDSISVFDLDDTLVVTNAKIIVIDTHTGEEYKLSASDYNKYERQAHHKLDFSQFDDRDILLNGRPIEWVLNILKKTINKNKACAIITARGDKKPIIDFFKKHDISINPDLIFAVNPDGPSKYKGNNAERKKQAFKELIDLGYRNFKFFDDNLDNLEYAKQLEHEYDDVVVKCTHILDKWIPKFDD